MTRVYLAWLAVSTGYVISSTIDNVLLGIAMVSTALIGMGVIWKKGIQPAANFLHKTARAVDALFEIRDKQREDEERFVHIEARLEVVEEKMAADVTVRHEITSAAGEQGPPGPQGPPGAPGFDLGA